MSSSFTTTLGKGSEGADVTKLQTYLAKDPSLYPEGTISGYFGSLTEGAVKRFQQKHNIVSSGTPLTTGYGTVGPKTRATLNSLLTTTSSTPIPSEPAAPKEPASNGTGPLAQANRSPNLSITGERFVTLPNKVTLTALATDDGLPTNTLPRRVKAGSPTSGAKPPVKVPSPLALSPPRPPPPLSAPQAPTRSLPPSPTPISSLRIP